MSPVPEGHQIRPINRSSPAEIELVATRMRQTLIEVIGEEEGGSMYTMDWLKQRVLFHLDPLQSTAQVFVSIGDEGQITGHTIVRVERDESGREFGLFSTTYVDPESRKQGIADSLLLRGEKWMIERGMTAAETYTSDSNVKLIQLYRKHGYEITGTRPDKKMVILGKRLSE
jgi:ribosomal protein S18 acetylase RimI-like enzyme